MAITSAKEALSGVFGPGAAFGAPGLGQFQPGVTQILQQAGFPVPSGIGANVTFPQYETAAKARELARKARLQEHPFEDVSRAFDEIQSLWSATNSARARQFLKPISFQDFLSGNYEGGRPVAQRIQTAADSLFAKLNPGGGGAAAALSGTLTSEPAQPSIIEQITGKPQQPTFTPPAISPTFNANPKLSPFQQQVKQTQQSAALPNGVQVTSSATAQPALPPALPNGITVQAVLKQANGDPNLALASINMHANELIQAGVYDSWRAYLQRIAQGG